MTALTCAVDAENKENKDSQNCAPARHLSPGRIHGAPLRLVDANKLVFAPSPARVKKACVVRSDTHDNSHTQATCDLDALSTLELVELVRDKMERLRVEASTKTVPTKNDDANSEIIRLREQVDLLTKNLHEERDKKRNLEHIEQVQLKRHIKQLEEQVLHQRQSQSPKVKANKLESDLNQTRQQLCDQRDFFEKRLKQVQDKHEKEVNVWSVKVNEYRRRLEKSTADTQHQQETIYNMNLKYAEAIHSYERHVAHLEACLAKATARTAPTNTSAAATKITSTITSQDLHRFEREKAALKDALRRATDELNALEANREDCERTISDLKHALCQQRAETEALRQPYAKAKSAAEYYEQSMGVVQQRLQRLGEENRYLRSILPVSKS